MALRQEDTDRGISKDTVLASRGRGEPLLFHRQLVGKRLYVNSQVRFLVVVGIVAGALGARYVLGIETLDMPGLLVLAGLLCVFNVGVFVFARRYKGLERRVPVNRLLMGVTHLTIGLDFIFLTAGLWLVGGAKSPFQAFYLIHVVLAAALLSPRAAYAHAAFGYVLFGGLVLGEWGRVFPVHFPVGIVNSATPLDGRFVLTVLIVQGMLMVLAVYLVTGLTSLLRRGEQQLRDSNAELERMSKLQRDFLHIALHDLKSPVNAATMLLQSMKIASNPPLTEQQSGWLERARVRLCEASAFLYDFTVLAELDAANVRKQAKDVNLAVLVENAVAENQDLLCSHGHTLHLEIAQDLPHVHGIDRLLQEAVANLITNADKYTPANGTVTVRVRRGDTAVRIEVEDTGIGIAPEDQGRLFQEFVRVRRKDSPVGEVAGSGLGLSIVRRVIETHRGKVGVISELNKGSTFFIELPVSSTDHTPVAQTG